MQKDDFPLYSTNQKIKEQRTRTKACKIDILYFIYLKKKQTIIRLTLFINTVFCALAYTLCDSIQKYSD